MTSCMCEEREQESARLRVVQMSWRYKSVKQLLFGDLFFLLYFKKKKPNFTTGKFGFMDS